MSVKAPSYVKRYHSVLFNAYLLNNLNIDPATHIATSDITLIDAMRDIVSDERTRLIKELFKYRVPGNTYDVPENGQILVILPNCNFNVVVKYNNVKKIHMGAYPINTYIQITDNARTTIYHTAGNPAFIGI